MDSMLLGFEYFVALVGTCLVAVVAAKIGDLAFRRISRRRSDAASHAGAAECDDRHFRKH